MSGKWLSSLSNLPAWWGHLASRDRRALTLAACAVGFYGGWVVAIQPAWRTLQKAPPEINRLENQWQQLNRMAQESRVLQEILPVPNAQAITSVQSATDRLGPQGRISILGNQATLTLTNVPPAALKNWLSEVRSAARARPVEVQLNRTGQGYSGTIMLILGGPAS
ncbi:MAG: type II secretion system protein GspM [Burkholderiales bacterium]|jgi:general secretion pathway protein M